MVVSALDIGSTIYIQESGGTTPYILIDHNYNGSANSLLMRTTPAGQSAFWFTQPSNTYNSKYEDSHLNTQMTSFYNGLPSDTQGKIQLTSVPVIRSAGYYSEIIAIERYVFPLSSKEIFNYGGGSSESAAEGEYIEFFDSYTFDISHYTRSVGGGMTGYANYVTTMGERGNSSGTAARNYIPCFCVSPDAILSMENDQYYL